MILSQSRSFACNGVPKRELGNQKQPETKVIGGTVILPVQRTGWKPVPPKLNVGCGLRTINPVEWRAGTPTPLNFSSFMGGAKAHERMLPIVCLRLPRGGNNAELC